MHALLSVVILALAAVIVCVLGYAYFLIGGLKNTLSEEIEKTEVQRLSADNYLRQWTALLNANQDPVLLIRSDGQCDIANHSALLLFPKAEGSMLLNFTQSAELTAFARAVSAETASATVALGEFLLPKPAERLVQASAYPTGDGSAILILRDLTDLRRLETVRRDFVANVSHELRTPLSSVKAMAETLIDGAIDDSEVAKHFLETIVHESDRLVRLSADLLDLSRVESQPAQKELRDISPLIHNVVAGYAAQIKAAGHKVLIDIEEPLILFVDPDEISQVMVNLVDNAIKYTPNSGSIRIWSRSNEDHVIISVSDTGIGILQQDLPRLFERFYRTDKARSRASGGTGLGLSIVKHIVERHDGSVSVESEYNHGSIFSFTLPRTKNLLLTVDLSEQSTVQVLPV